MSTISAWHAAFRRRTIGDRTRSAVARSAPPAGAAPRLGAAAAAALVVLAAGGCYEHVTKGDPSTREGHSRFEPSTEEEGPSILNELMWGPPPKGEDPVKYYRRKNSLGFQQ
ncbi:MAG: hypothetical protein FJ253_01680 [Phycisphaerae bacterium]|nr:hypothetical protein [Phycisphaerae bacterium]